MYPWWYVIFKLSHFVLQFLFLDFALKIMLLFGEAYQWPGYVDFQKDVAFLYNADKWNKYVFSSYRCFTVSVYL